MSPIADLLRSSPYVRRFFLAYLQSALGNGMGYVALVLVALDRFHSPWAVAAILIADLVPLMALGPLLGGAADRLPRRACAVAADLVRAVAFIGIAVTGSLPAALILAALAGAGNGVFDAAVLVGRGPLCGDGERGRAGVHQPRPGRRGGGVLDHGEPVRRRHRARVAGGLARRRRVPAVGPLPGGDRRDGRRLRGGGARAGLPR